MARKGIFGHINSTLVNTLDTIDSVVNETLTTAQFGFKTITNSMEETHNDSMQELMDSRVTTMTKLTEAKKKLTDLGYSDEQADSILNFNRRA